MLTIKQLYGYSSNECAHPECDRTLIKLDVNTGKHVNYSEIAHIHGQKPGAERFLQEVFDDKKKLHGFYNLLLLCGEHHTQIDQEGAGKVYTADVVRKWKHDHMLKYIAETDREWVFGGQTINFWVEDEQVSLSYWITENGELKFHTDEQLLQTAAARDLSLLFGQLGSMLSILDQTTGEPADPSHQTFNDGYIRMLKKYAEEMKSSWLGTAPEGGYESGLHRLYSNLKQCPDITLGELADVGSEKRAMRTTLIIGEATPERIDEALLSAKDDAAKRRGE
ncbi:hypothetical protein [Ruegeria lacuscaerulensis]|uniref:hypothetical protein n=1 Tax=Ruegeria lacuscaerulensis TaxID=55218 RepID=UPI001479AF81|nr:hypothetical protein [Ruegeria lacuscaerulensis]